jgi:flagellar motor protein MotB
VDIQRPAIAPPAATVRHAGDNALWLMTLADVTMLLLCFFVVLAAAPGRSQTHPPPAASGVADNATRPDAERREPSPARHETPERETPTPRTPHRLPDRRHPKNTDLIRTFMVDAGTMHGLDRFGPPTRLARYGDAMDASDLGLPSMDPATSVEDETRPAVDRSPDAAETPDDAAPVAVRPGVAPAGVAPSSDPQQQAVEHVEATLRDILSAAGDRVEVTPDRGAVTVRLHDTITFGSGRADLLPEARRILGHVAVWLANHPEIRLEVSGHTDDVPIATALYPSNWELSAARAAAVARHLLTEAAIDPRRAHIAAYGEHRPLAGGRDHTRNRRVEIRFFLPVSSTS